MAEGVFQSLAKSNPRIGTIDSCGTGAYHTLDPPNERTMAVLERNGITDYDHGARQVTKEDFNNFDYIFAMDDSNLRNLLSLQKRVESRGTKSRAKVMLFGEYGGGRTAEVVVDPYYGPDSGFETAYEQVRRFSINFLRDVVDK